MSGSTHGRSGDRDRHAHARIVSPHTSVAHSHPNWASRLPTATRHHSSARCHSSGVRVSLAGHAASAAAHTRAASSHTFSIFSHSVDVGNESDWASASSLALTSRSKETSRTKQPTRTGGLIRNMLDPFGNAFKLPPRLRDSCLNQLDGDQDHKDGCRDHSNVAVYGNDLEQDHFERHFLEFNRDAVRKPIPGPNASAFCRPHDGLPDSYDAQPGFLVWAPGVALSG